MNYDELVEKADKFESIDNPNLKTLLNEYAEFGAVFFDAAIAGAADPPSFYTMQQIDCFRYGMARRKKLCPWL